VLRRRLGCSAIEENRVSLAVCADRYRFVETIGALWPRRASGRLNWINWLVLKVVGEDVAHDILHVGVGMAMRESLRALPILELRTA
jgi:hypothetical protein